MDTLGIEPRASRMLSGCDTTTPRARDSEVFAQIAALPRAVARQLRGGGANLQSKSSGSSALHAAVEAIARIWAWRSLVWHVEVLTA